jgi:hypothetical protein
MVYALNSGTEYIWITAGFGEEKRIVRPHALLCGHDSYDTTSPTSVLTSVRNVQGGSNMTGTNCDLFTHK